MNSDEALYLTLKTGISNLKLNKIISKDYGCSYYYAKEIIKSRFELGEKAISKNYVYSYLYATHVIKGKFELGEKAISKVSYYAWSYAISVLKGRFKLGEKSIVNNMKFNYHVNYVENFIGYDHK